MFESIQNWLFNEGPAVLAIVLKAAFIAVAGLMIIKAIMKIVTKALEKSKLEKAGHNLVKTLARTVMYILLSLMIASSLNM